MPVKTVPPVLPADSPLLSPPYQTQQLAWSLKALAAGDADKGQQTMVLRWIVVHLCGVNDMAYRPGRQDDTNFALGKQHVGQQITILTNMTPEQIKDLPRLGVASDDDELPNM